MSSSILTTIQSQLNIYQYPFFLIVGNIGNILIVILLSQQRQNTCSMYLISSAIINDMHLTLNSLIQIFPLYYADETTRAFVLCKFRSYLSNILGQTARTMLILACIDRFLISSARATFRAFSTPERAKWIIPLVIIFWLLFASHIPIMTTIVNKQCGTFGIYSIIYNIYVIIFTGLMPPIALGVFGYLTYRNMKQRQLRVQPVVHNTVEGNITIRPRDRDLLIIVICEVTVYVVTTGLYPLILLETMISKYTISDKSILYSQIESFILNIAFTLLYVNNCATFFVYLISSKPLRRDFKQLIINGYRKLTRQQPIVQTIPRYSCLIK